MEYGSPFSTAFIDAQVAINYLDIYNVRGSVLAKFTPKLGYSQNFIPIIDGKRYPPVFGSDTRVNLVKARGNPRFTNHIMTLVPIGLSRDIGVDVLPFQQAFEDLHPSKLKVNFRGVPRFFSVGDDGQFSNWNVSGVNRFNNCRSYQAINGGSTYGAIDVVVTSLGSIFDPLYKVDLNLNNFPLATGTGVGTIAFTALNDSGINGSVDLVSSETPALNSLLITQFPNEYYVYIQDHPFNETNPGGSGEGGSDFTAIDDLSPVAIIQDNGHSSQYSYSTDDIIGGTYYVLVRQRFDCIESLNNIPAIILLDIVPSPPGRPVLISGVGSEGETNFLSFQASLTPNVSYNIYDSLESGVQPNDPTYHIVDVPDSEGMINIDLNDLNDIGTDFTGYRYFNVRAVTPASSTGDTVTEGSGNIEEGNYQTLAIEYAHSEIIPPRPVAPGVVGANVCGLMLTVQYYQSMATVQLDTPIVNAQAYKVELFIFLDGTEPDYTTPIASEMLSNNVGTAINGSITGFVLAPGNYKFALRSVAYGGIGSSGTEGLGDVQSNNVNQYGPLLFTEIETPNPVFDVSVSG